MTYTYPLVQWVTYDWFLSHWEVVKYNLLAGDKYQVVYMVFTLTAIFAINETKNNIYNKEKYKINCITWLFTKYRDAK